jgi:hypothetical protein
MKVTFHSFAMSDVEDVDIYVADPISRWQQTEQGQWVMENATDLKYYTMPDPNTFGYQITISGDIQEGPLLTEYLLRYHPFGQNLYA